MVAVLIVFVLYSWYSYHFYGEAIFYGVAIFYGEGKQFYERRLKWCHHFSRGDLLWTLVQDLKILGKNRKFTM